MSKFMPKSVSGNFDPDGTTGHTHLLNIPMTDVSDKVSQLDPNLLSSYTAINETTAYFKFLTNQINGIDSTFTVNANSKYHEYIIRYIMITTFIMMSGISEGINCEASYLRIGQDNFSPFRNQNNTYKGEHYFDDILNSWAEYLDPGLITLDSNPATPIRMLCVVKLNGVPVAYYTSKNERVMFYPFNTITSDANAVSSLTGIGINPKTNEWEFDYNTFKGTVLYKFGDSQKNVLAAALQQYANIPGDGNGFGLIMKELGNLTVPHGCQPFDRSDNGIADMLPVKITSYTNPGAKMFYENFMCSNKMNDLLRVPCARNRVNGKSDSIFYALGYTLPLCQILNNNWLMVTQCVDDNIKFYVNNQEVGAGGISWTQNNSSVTIAIRYTDGNGNTINLGNNYQINADINNNKFIWNEENNQLICGCNPPITIKPFLDKYWDEVPDVVPLSRALIQTLEGMNCSIEDCLCNNGSVSFNIVDNGNGMKYLIKRNYDEENDSLPYEISQGNTAIYRDMPQISIFPFCAIKDENDNSVWNKYYFTATALSFEVYSYFRKIEFKYKNGTGAYTVMKFDKKSLFDNSGKNTVAFRCDTDIIPKHIFVEEDSQEIGVIIVPEPEVKNVNSQTKAIMGVDMGSRNSIVAFYDTVHKPPFHRYNYKGLVRDLIHSYKPYMVNNDINDKLKKDWDEILNLHGLTDEDVNNSFTSAVLDYMDASANLRNTPMVHGRIIADLSESSFKKIIKLAENLNTLSYDKLANIGYHSNFKRALWNSNNNSLPAPYVELFVKNLCYRLVFIAFCQGCGNIELRFTAPNATVGNRLMTIWNSAVNGSAVNGSTVKSVRTEFGIPNNIKITVGAPMLESVALYYHIQNNSAELPFRYSIVIDGGDSTFDVSVIKQDSNSKLLCDSFSIKYAGYNLLVESIIEVVKAKAYNKNNFVDMWIPDYGFADSINAIRSTVNELMSPISGENDSINWDSKCIEDVIYKLIESVGLCKNNKTKEVFALIKLKYFMLLNAIVKTCVDNIQDDNSDQPVSVFLYGGSNRIAEMLFSDDRDVINSSFSEVMTKWLGNYENSSKTPGIVVNYNVNPNKLELVQGLVMTNNNNTNNNSADVHADYKNTMYTQETYNSIINEVFPKNEAPEYWGENGEFLLKSDISRLSELIAPTADEVMDKVRIMLSMEFKEPLNVHDEAVYPLATMIYAIRQFKKTIKPDRDN